MLKAASALREGLWAVIQSVASELPFDYHAYADRLRIYARVRKARG